MSFKVNDKQLLNNYNEIWEKIKKLMKIDFESKSAYSDGDKHITTKIKIHAGSITTNSHNKEMPKKNTM